MEDIRLKISRTVIKRSTLKSKWIKIKDYENTLYSLTWCSFIPYVYKIVTLSLFFKKIAKSINNNPYIWTTNLFRNLFSKLYRSSFYSQSKKNLTTRNVFSGLFLIKCITQVKHSPFINITVSSSSKNSLANITWFGLNFIVASIKHNVFITKLRSVLYYHLCMD